MFAKIFPHILRRFCLPQTTLNSPYSPCTTFPVFSLYAQGSKNTQREIFVFNRVLKVPKCEIFHRSDFPDFYTINSRREGDFGVKIKKF
jgi:hypothetical protein